MTKPTIHMNGTSAGELYRQWEAVAEAARTLLTALREATPNGRDYYPQGPEAASAAIREHEARLAHVHRIAMDAGELMEVAAERM